MQQVWLLHQSLFVRGQAWETMLPGSLDVRSPLKERESWRDSCAKGHISEIFLEFSRSDLELTWEQRDSRHHAEDSGWRFTCVSPTWSSQRSHCGVVLLPTSLRSRINQEIGVMRERKRSNGRDLFARRYYFDMRNEINYWCSCLASRKCNYDI